MNKGKVTPEVQRAVFHSLTSLEAKHGVSVIAAASRWVNHKREERKIARQIKAAEDQAAELRQRAQRQLKVR